MGNPVNVAQMNSLPVILIDAGLPARTSKGEAQLLQIFAPWLAELPIAQRDLLALLPVLDVNGAVLAALQDRQAPQHSANTTATDRTGVIVSLLCVDPFLRVRDIIALLRAAGIPGVANFPTIQVIDGVAALGFDSADLGLRREAQMLERFAQEGLEVTGFVTTAENGQRLLDHGASALVIHPGPPSVDWRNRAISARSAADTLQALRPNCDVPLRLFCPDGYGAELDAARSLADGFVRYT